jgi:hypothetical protein
MGNTNSRVFKISRNLNATAHTLATQALMPLGLHAQLSCTNRSHSSSCPTLAALNSVTWETFSLIAASCC